MARDPLGSLEILLCPLVNLQQRLLKVFQRIGHTEAQIAFPEFSKRSSERQATPACSSSASESFLELQPVFVILGKATSPTSCRGHFCCFCGSGSGALRRVRGRSSQVKGACGVAARGRCAPPWTCEPLRPLRAELAGRPGACPTGAQRPRTSAGRVAAGEDRGMKGARRPVFGFWPSTTRDEDGGRACARRGYGGGCSGSSTR